MEIYFLVYFPAGADLETREVSCDAVDLCGESTDVRLFFRHCLI